MDHRPTEQTLQTPARRAILRPGTGCLAAPGVFVLDLTGTPVRCISPAAQPAGVAPSPLTVAAEVDSALAAMRVPPRQVIIGADVDPLVAGDAWDEAAFAAASRLVEHGVGLTLCTRGVPGEGGGGRAWDGLLVRAARGGGASLEIALFTLDATLAALYEPEVPAPSHRLLAASRLAGQGVKVEARIHALLPWISDTAAHLETLTQALSRAGVRRLRASYLHIEGHGRRRLSRLPPAHRALLRGCLEGAPARSGEVRLLPRTLRHQGHRRLVRIAAEVGIVATTCHESNPDLAEACRCLSGGARPVAAASMAETASGSAARGAGEAPRGKAAASATVPVGRVLPPPSRRRRGSAAKKRDRQLALFS